MVLTSSQLGLLRRGLLVMAVAIPPGIGADTSGASKELSEGVNKFITD